MNTKKTFTQINDSDKKKNGVVSLAVRPNMQSTYGEGGLTAKQLQSRFDKLAGLIITRYNEMAAALSGSTALEYLGLPEHITNEDIPNLSALIVKLVDADGDLVVVNPEDQEEIIKLNSVLKDFYADIEKVGVLESTVEALPTTVDVEMSDTDYNLKITLKDAKGEAVSSSEIDLPLESSVIAVRFDNETRQIKFLLRDQQEEVVVDLDDVFSGVVTSLDDEDPTKALSAATGALIKQKIQDAVAAEKKERIKTDDTHTAGIAALKTRLDSLDLPIIQKSLYEHNIYFYTTGAFPTVRVSTTIYSASADVMTYQEVLEYLANRDYSNGYVGGEFNAIVVDEIEGVEQWFLGRLNEQNGTTLYVQYSRDTLAIDAASVMFYDEVTVIANISEGGGGNAIIECLTLPTENISVTHFYRTSDGKLHWHDGSSWHHVIEETDLPKDSNGGYFEGTAAEYNEAADTVPVGAIVWLTDEEGNITTAVLDKAILGQMILGTS